MIIIAGRVYVDPAEVEAFVTDLRATITEGEAAEGNLFLSFTLDNPAMGSVIVLERWRDRASIDAYLQTPVVGAFFDRWADRMQNESKLYDASNERDLWPA